MARGRREEIDDERDEDDRVRVDKWLWAARFYKTRSLATEAVNGGKVELNGERAKPAKMVKAGDTVRVRVEQFEHVLTVLDVAERRGSATVAATLYEETEDSRARREKMREQLKYTHALFVQDEGKPTKKDRREIDRFRGR